MYKDPKIEKRNLVKSNQELYSWYWFYTNDCTNLQCSRYPKYDKDTDRLNKEIKLDYSARYKEDRLRANRIYNQIKENKSKIEKLAVTHNL